MTVAPPLLVIEPGRSFWMMRVVVGIAFLAVAIALARGLLITPTEAEWRDLRLPPALYFLYYPYRLARLVGKRTSASTSL